MTAGEAEDPRRNLPKAFKSVFYRLFAFFALGSLCVGLVVPYNDPDLRNALSDARPGAGSSPYVIAMQHMHIPVLPHIVNALVLSAVFSAGNSYVFCASRTLYGLALEGKAPKFLTRVTGNGVPVYCVGFTLAVALLCKYCVYNYSLLSDVTVRPAFLQVSSNSAVVLQWFVNLVTASQLLNFAIISFTYIRFHAVSALIPHGAHSRANEVMTVPKETRDFSRYPAIQDLLATILRVRVDYSYSELHDD